MRDNNKQAERRKQLLQQIERLSRVAVFGTLSETYRACGSPGCRCHGPGPKHGPYLNISYRGDAGKTTGYTVPRGAETAIREGVEAWRSLQLCLREVAGMNKERALDSAREGKEKTG